MGLGGPPLVQAALGVTLTPEEIGPADVHVRSGVIDLLADDDAHAITLARRYLAFFGPATEPPRAPDPLPLRELVPLNPRRAYDVRKVIAHLADLDSSLELKPGWGRSVVTSPVRIDGPAVGVVANQPMHAARPIDPAHAVTADRTPHRSAAIPLTPLLR